MGGTGEAVLTGDRAAQARMGLADRGRGEKAGLPELDKLLQTAENTCENGRDHGVHGGGQPGAVLPRRFRGVAVGDPGAERRRFNYHLSG